MYEPEITKQGLLNMQVCVHKDFTDKQVHDFAEQMNPCDTQHGWAITKQGHELLSGDNERVACCERKDFVHIMLHC